MSLIEWMINSMFYKKPKLTQKHVDGDENFIGVNCWFCNIEFKEKDTYYVMDMNPNNRLIAEIEVCGKCMEEKYNFVTKDDKSTSPHYD